ncbi:MAG: hypothetical protein WCE80_10290 [Acidimicrobiia bacterium]
MRAIRALGVALAIVLAGAGCVGGDAASTTTSGGAATTASSVAPSTLPPIVECPGDGEFQEGTGIAEFGEDASDGRHLRRISWDTSDRCETITFDFETSEGAPAISAPAVRIDHLDTFQVIRIQMDIDSATVTDQLVETALVDRLYVVRALDGTTFVDLLLNGPAAARARVESTPARLTVDLKPGLVQFKGAATVGDDVVAVAPGARTSVGVTRLQGYARTTEADLIVGVSQGDQMLVDRTTPVALSEGWGEFQQDVALPAGTWQVFIGRPTQDGFDGIQFDLTAG